MELTIEIIFKQIVNNPASDAINLSALEDIYNCMNPEEFTKRFLSCLCNTFACRYKNRKSYVDRIFDFCTNFITSVQPVHENERFVDVILRKLILLHTVKSEDFRYHLCEFINKQLWKIEEEFDNDLTDTIIEAMIERFNDCKASVCVQAANVLYHFQNPNDENDRITHIYLDNITNPNKEIRCAVVRNMDMSAHTREHIIKRCRDVDQKVRFVTYKKLLDVPFDMFKIEQRREILKNGLNDTSKVVKKFVVESMLPKLLADYNNDYLAFMRALRFDSDEKDVKDTRNISELALKALFSVKTRSEIHNALTLSNKLIPINELNWENAMYWDILIGYLRCTNDSEEFLEPLLPETVIFCNYIEEYYSTFNFDAATSSEQKYYYLILYHLVNIAVNSDISEESVRIRLKKLFIKMLKRVDISFDTMEKIMLFFEKLMPNVDKRTDFICEVMSDIRVPFESAYTQKELQHMQAQLVELKARMHDFTESQASFVERQEFMKANDLKLEIWNCKNLTESITNKLNDCGQVVRKNDEKTVNRYLDIGYLMLQSPQITKLNSSLTTFREELCLDLALFKDPEIKSKLLKCFALCCYLNEGNATISIKLYCHSLYLYRKKESYDLDVLLVSIGVLSDYILLFGTSIFPVTNDAPDILTVSEIIEIFTIMMDDELIEIRQFSCKHLLKVLISKRIQSPIVLIRLIIKWFNPMTDLIIQQMISMFMEHFNEIEDASNQLEASMIPVLQTICLAPNNSPLYAIPIMDVAKFFVAMTSYKVTQNWDTHRNMAFLLCNELLKGKSTKCNVTYVKTLLLLHLDYKDQSMVDELISLCDDIEDDTMDRNVQKYISKFAAQLKYALAEPLRSNENGAASDQEERNSKEVHGIKENGMKENGIKEENDIKEENFIEENGIDENAIEE